MGDQDDAKRKERQKKFKKDLENLGRDFSKTGTFGKIPEPADKWGKNLGGTPPVNKIYLIDSAGKAVNIGKVEEWCGKTYWLACLYQQAAGQDCSQNYDFGPAVVNAEETLLKEAEPLFEKCEQQGCTPVATLEWEWWYCTTLTVPGANPQQVVEVNIVISIECFSL